MRLYTSAKALLSKLLQNHIESHSIRNIKQKSESSEREGGGNCETKQDQMIKDLDDKNHLHFKVRRNTSLIPKTRIYKIFTSEKT